ncbi:hypothetical protein [Umezawaea sp. Da 62-37]|uniref:hypothetical protein n=1 Tax=Umezawaea sp. Da 62-37 TaxID=3075927 RepID=UPI0028F6E242|nr:hypothetical protein [Umezawaea sp. Da 62-37]WNV89467.1 hypothetical protein RM788_14545 [Umezawaea sp. Da 62-37]
MGKRWPVLAAVLVLAVSGCSSSPSRATAEPDHPVTADRAGRTQADLTLLTGATAIVVRSADLGGDLFRAWSPDGKRVVPRATVDGDVVDLSFDNADEARIELASDVTWSVHLNGGAKVQTLDLRTAKLKSVDFGAGSDRIDLTLPPPTGAVPVRMTGGASIFDLHLPRGAQAQVRFSGGAGHAVIDGASTSGLAGGTVLRTADLDTATDHYAVDAVAGVAELTVDRT